MIAIVVVASLVAYAWIMGYIGFNTSKSGDAITLQSFTAADYQVGTETKKMLTVYVQNTGQGAIQLNPHSSVYVDDKLVEVLEVDGEEPEDMITVEQGATVALLLNCEDTGKSVTIKVVTTGGTFCQITGKAGTGSSDNQNQQGPFTLTVTPTGSGSITVTPNKAEYAYGEAVTLEAVPESGWILSSWGGDLSGQDSTRQITMTRNKVVTATFTEIPINQFALTTTTEGSGSITRNPDAPTYTDGTTVTLTANAQLGWTFTSWSGDTTSTSGNTATVTMNAVKTVTAHFTQNEYTLTIDYAGTGTGTVTKSPDQPTYHYDDIVQLTANPDTSSTFTDWSGDATSSTNPVSITINGNKAVTATFTQDAPTTASLTVTFAGTGTGSVNDGSETKTATFSKEYTLGSTVTLALTAGSGSTFTSWTGDGSGSPQRTIQMSEDREVTVTFNPQTTANLIRVPGFETNDATWVTSSTGGGSADKYNNGYPLTGSRNGLTSTANPNSGTSNGILTQSLTATPVSSIVDSSSSLSVNMRRIAVASDGTNSVEVRVIAGSTTYPHLVRFKR